MTRTPSPDARALPSLSRRTRSRGMGVGVTALLLMLVVVAPAHGHATLLDTSPQEGAELDDHPAEVVLTFDEAVEPAGDALVLTDGDGTTHDLEAVVGPESGQISAQVPSEAAGDHAVAWRIVAADGHVQEGEFTYTVTAPPDDTDEDPEPDEAAEPDDAGDDRADDAPEQKQDLGADAAGAEGEDEGGAGWLIAVGVLVLAAVIAGALVRSGRRHASFADGEA